MPQYYPSPREILADALLTESVDTMFGTHSTRHASFAALAKAPTPATVWEAIHGVMEQMHYFHLNDPELEQYATSAEIESVRIGLAELGISAEWSAPFAPERQRIVCMKHTREPLPDANPYPGDPRPRLVEFMADARRPHGVWWTPPLTYHVQQTSSPLPTLPASDLLGGEDDFGAAIANVRPALRATGDLNIKEIDSVADWLDLVRSAPVDVTRSRERNWGMLEPGLRWVIPDWAALAERYDAIHLTVNGYLDLSCVPIETAPGERTMVVGWGPEETYWLREPKLEWGEQFRAYRYGPASWGRTPEESDSLA